MECTAPLAGGERFAFNFYRNWAQLLFCQLGQPPVTIMSREGVTQGYPILVILYRITLTPLTEELRAVDPGLLPPFIWIMRRLMVRHDIVHRY